MTTQNHLVENRTYRSGVALLAAHPAMPAKTAITATVKDGIEKFPVLWVTWPTAHVRKAPASEPPPPSSPAFEEGLH